MREASGCHFGCGVVQAGLARGVERVMGIEPTFSAWEADVLPLNYTRMDEQEFYCIATASQRTSEGAGAMGARP